MLSSPTEWFPSCFTLIIASNQPLKFAPKPQEPAASCYILLYNYTTHSSNKIFSSSLIPSASSSRHSRDLSDPVTRSCQSSSFCLKLKKESDVFISYSPWTGQKAVRPAEKSNNANDAIVKPLSNGNLSHEQILAKFFIEIILRSTR